MKKVFVIYQIRNAQKIIFGYTDDHNIATSELIRLSVYSTENKFIMNYDFIPVNGVKLK